MADEPNENPNDAGTSTDGGKAYAPPATQADLDAIIKDRVARERAKFADYADLKSKAARLDTIEQANKTEAEKTAERISALEQELESTRSTALRSRIQAKYGISDDDAALYLTATDEDTLAKQAAGLAERAAERKKSGNRAPLQGRAPTRSSGDEAERAAARSLFGAGD